MLFLTIEVADTSYERDFFGDSSFLASVFGCFKWFAVEFVVISHDSGKKSEKIRVSRYEIRETERDSSIFTNLCHKSTHLRHTCALIVSLKRSADDGD